MITPISCLQAISHPLVPVVWQRAAPQQVHAEHHLGEEILISSGASDHGVSGRRYDLEPRRWLAAGLSCEPGDEACIIPKRCLRAQASGKEVAVRLTSPSVEWCTRQLKLENPCLISLHRGSCQPCQLVRPSAAWHG